MRELRIVRGRDIAAFINGEPLFGLTELSVRGKQTYHSINEFLSSVPVERVPQGTVYEIKLRIMALFDGQLPIGEPFVFSLVEDGIEYIWNDCLVTEEYSAVQGNKYAEQGFKLEAMDYEERVVEDG